MSILRSQPIWKVHSKGVAAVQGRGLEAEPLVARSLGRVGLDLRGAGGRVGVLTRAVVDVYLGPVVGQEARAAVGGLEDVVLADGPAGGVLGPARVFVQVQGRRYSLSRWIFPAALRGMAGTSSTRFGTL